LSGQPAVIAVDVGGTTLKGAVFTDSGSLVASSAVPTFAADGAALTALIALVESLLSAAHAAHAQPRAIGIATPGLVNAHTGTVAFAANLGWRDIPLGPQLSERFSLPVVVDHDARAGALAEITALGATEQRDAVFLPIGTGIGAAVIANGAPVPGAIGAAGEVGHIPVVPDGEPCSCGSRGCLEVYASAHNIHQRYLRFGGRTAQSTQELVGLLAVDVTATRVWTDAVSALTTGIVSLTATLDPAVIILGGGLGMAGETLLAPLRAELIQRLTWRTPPRLVQSAFGAQSSVIGAGLLAAQLEPEARASFASRAAQTLAESSPQLHRKA
jgi:glucokinase